MLRKLPTALPSHPGPSLLLDADRYNQLRSESEAHYLFRTATNRRLHDQKLTHFHNHAN